MKKGFTLIELLAVIVILAVIALIATPVILGIIDDAKRSAFKDSAYGLEHAAELLYAQNLMDQTNNTIIFTYEDGLESSSPEGFQLNYKGEKPKNGQIVVESDGTVRLSVHNGKYCITKTSLSDVAMEEKELSECSLPDIPAVYRFTKDNSKAPAPELADNMIAIVRDNNKWVKADASIQEDWYNYETKVWANAVTVSEASRSKYVSAEAGTEIKEEDILTYLVWVPRYKYKLFNVESAEMQVQTIEVVFEDKSVTKSRGSKNGEYLTHPAFTFGDTELNGIWVGKFETTGSIDTPCTDELCTTSSLTVKPGLASIVLQTTSSMFYATRSMQKSGNVYGFDQTVDTHMMKNTEWGSVAYLTNSKYGKNSEIWINNYNNHENDTSIITNYATRTGCVGNSVSEGASVICQNTYDSKIGINGSTTGNIYGIYDMSGGAYERVMGGMYNSDNQTVQVRYSGFVQETIDQVDFAKYVDKYPYGDETAFNLYSRRLLGDAIGETYGWNSDYSNFIRDLYPWMNRGGAWYNTQTAGIFCFNLSGGAGAGSYSFRVIVNVE